MWKAILLFAVATALTGCVVSVSPVVDEDHAVYEPWLEGTWEAVGEPDRAVIARGPGASYTIEYTSDDDVGRLRGRLGQLGDHLVLDVQPAPRSLPQPFAELLIPGHLLLVLERAGPDEVQLSLLDPEGVLAVLDTGGLALPYDSTESTLVVQGSTEELRAALALLLERPESLDPQGSWRRAPPRQVSTAQARPRSVAVPCFEAAPWREADALFRGHSHWRGADAASSVDLGDGRVLWLFADTWIDPTGQGTRRGATIISNSVAVQTGLDPSSATIEYHWGRGPDGEPAALFPDRDGERLWFGSGARVEDRLILFMGRIGPGPGIGFASRGWTAFLVANPDDPPAAWEITELDTPDNPLGGTVGFAASLRHAGHLVALGSLDPVKSHPIYAARWPIDAARDGRLMEPEWWAGEAGWVPDSSSVPRWPIFEDGQSEISVHLDAATDRFLSVHTRGFGPADVMIRAAPELAGPWTDARMVYRPPEYHRPGVMIYAAKAHPELEGADLVLTYATNSFDVGAVAADSSLYYPRFVRLQRCQR